MLQVKIHIRVEGSIDKINRFSVCIFKEVATYGITCLVVVNPLVAELLTKILDVYAIVIKE